MTQKLSKHKFHILCTMFVLISFMLGCNEFMVVGNLTLIANTYHESLSQISFLVATFSWTYAIVTPFLAILTNHIHKYYLLIELMLVFLAGTILSSVAPSLNWLLLSRVITASVAGMLESLLSVIIYQLAHNPRQRSIGIAYIYTGFSLASVVGLPIGTLIASYWRWQAAFVMVAIVTIISTLIAFIVLPRDLPGGSGNYKDQLEILTDRQIWYGITFTIFAAASLYGYYTYIRPLIHQVLHFSSSGLSFVLLLLGIIDIFANQTSGRLAIKNGFKPLRFIYLFDLLLLALFYPLMANQWTGLALLLALGFFIVLFGSPIQVFFLDQAYTKHPNAVLLTSTLYATFYNIGIALASMSAGHVVAFSGLKYLGWNAFVYCLITTILTFILAKSRKNQVLEKNNR